MRRVPKAGAGTGVVNMCEWTDIVSCECTEFESLRKWKARTEEIAEGIQ